MRGRIVRAVALLLVVCWLLPTAPARAQTVRVVSFRSLGYGDLSAEGMFANLDYFFPLPPGTAPVAGGSVTFDFSHSSLLVPDRSTMTIVVNGQSLISIFLNQQNQYHGHLTAPLPVAGFTGTGFFVQVKFLLRLTRDPCEQTNNPALWATVFADSTFRLATRPTSQGPGLQRLDGFFTPSGTTYTPLSGKTPISLEVPSRLDAQELQAAGLVAFQVGRWAESSTTDPHLALNSSPAPSQPAIAVGNGRDLPGLGQWGTVSWDGRAFRSGQTPNPPDYGVLALKGSQAPQLLVSGATSAGTLAAARALVFPEQRQSLSGSFVSVKAGVPAQSQAYAWQAGAASFAELGIAQQQLVGPGEHDVSLDFERPAGWLVTNDSQLVLTILSSPSLATSTSWIDVSINGTDLGTRRLENYGTVARQYFFKLPADRLNTDLTLQPLRRLTLNLRLFLDLPEGQCIQVTPSGAWASILPSSRWLLPHHMYTGLDLGRFPSPFQEPEGRAPIVVLPDRPTPAQLDCGIQVMAALGRWSTGERGLPQLITASTVTRADRRSELIIIGGPKANSLAAALARSSASLYRPLTPMLDRVPLNAARGEMRVADSPWADGMKTLLLFSDTDAGLLSAARALTQKSLLGRLTGQSAILVPGLPAQTVEGASPTEPSPVSLAPTVQEPNAPGPPAWQVVGVILLGAFIGVVFLIIYRLFFKRKKPQPRVGIA